jgi:hypothetical protein
MLLDSLLIPPEVFASELSCPSVQSSVVAGFEAHRQQVLQQPTSTTLRCIVVLKSLSTMMKYPAKRK